VAEMPVQRTRAVKYVGTAIGDNLRAYRRRNRLDQERVAERMATLGIPWRQVTVSESELSRRNITVAELLALTVVLGVHVEDLLDPRLPDDRDGDSEGRESYLMLGDDATKYPISRGDLSALVCARDKRVIAVTWSDDNQTLAFGIEGAPSEGEQS
jgi:transcriptional regulator with XRE-family HTH domain